MAEVVADVPKGTSDGRTSKRVRKRTRVDGMCECDTEITSEEKEEGSQVMGCKTRGCEKGGVRETYSCFASSVLISEPVTCSFTSHAWIT